MRQLIMAGVIGGAIGAFVAGTYFHEVGYRAGERASLGKPIPQAKLPVKTEMVSAGSFATGQAAMHLVAIKEGKETKMALVKAAVPSGVNFMIGDSGRLFIDAEPIKPPS